MKTVILFEQKYNHIVVFFEMFPRFLFLILIFKFLDFFMKFHIFKSILG
jgi:hypothetical protein